MISVGGGVLLLCAAVCGAIMFDRPWVRLISVLYLAYFAVAVVVEIVRGKWGLGLLIVPILLVLLGMYVYDVHHMFDPRRRGKK